jgi:hypothetical protein
MKKLIGRGFFTKCYLNDDQKTVTLISSCHAKECMGFGGFPDSYLFPTIERLEYIGGSQVYTMQYYPNSKGLKTLLGADQWELYNILRKLNIPIQSNIQEIGFRWHEQFDTIPDKFEEEREAIKEALGAMFNYGSDIAFEISPRNVRAVDGKLLLLDCFFVVSQVRSKRGLK